MRRAEFGLSSVQEDAISSLVSELHDNPKLSKQLIAQLFADNGALARHIFAQVKRMPNQNEMTRFQLEEFIIKLISITYELLDKTAQVEYLEQAFGQVTDETQAVLGELRNIPVSPVQPDISSEAEKSKPNQQN